MFDFKMLRLASLLIGVFIYSVSHPGCDGDEGVGFPPIVLYGVY